MLHIYFKKCCIREIFLKHYEKLSRKIVSWQIGRHQIHPWMKGQPFFFSIFLSKTLYLFFTSLQLMFILDHEFPVNWEQKHIKNPEKLESSFCFWCCYKESVLFFFLTWKIYKRLCNFCANTSFNWQFVKNEENLEKIFFLQWNLYKADTL